MVGQQYMALGHVPFYVSVKAAAAGRHVQCGRTGVTWRIFIVCRCREVR